MLFPGYSLALFADVVKGKKWARAAAVHEREGLTVEWRKTKRKAKRGRETKKKIP